MTGVPPPQAPSGWVVARSGRGEGVGGVGVLKEPRKFWRGIEKSSGIWDGDVGLFRLEQFSAKTWFSRQLSSHCGASGSGVEVLTITDLHLACRLESSSAWRTVICFASALSSRLRPFLSEQVLADRDLLVLFKIKMELSNSLSTLVGNMASASLN